MGKDDFHQAEESHRLTRLERQGRPASDSSLIQPAPPSGCFSSHVSMRKREGRQSRHATPRRTGPVQDHSVFTAGTQEDREPYQKRRRHKTRADLYEPKLPRANANQRKRKDNQEPRTRSQRRGKSINLWSGTSSKYISQGRVTV